ncbi:MAG: cytochrome b [Hydrogenovibrio sp.]
MSVKNSSQTYGLVTRANHWITAVLFIGMIAFGIYMADLPKSPDKFELYDIHKSIGVIVLALVVLRLVWLKVSPNPPVIASKRSEEILAHSVRGILYLGLILMPLSGWVMSNAGGHEVAVFGWFTMPQIVPENETIGGIAKGVHAIAGQFILPLAILLHIAGAMKHHFVYKDATLKRMLGRDVPKD